MTTSTPTPSPAGAAATAGPAGAARDTATPDPVRLPRAVLIANRGEIAVRIARTCRSMGIRSIAVASEVDRGAAHVDACDEVVVIGGAAPAESYLDVAKLLEAARRSGADAVHPGFGFLAEDARFARAVQEAGLTWIGPSPEVIAAMGDKLEAKRRMAAADVPLVPGAELPEDADAAAIRAAAERIGLPVLVKAAAGGGGKGMRAVHHLDDLVDAVAAARREAAGAFGDDRVFLERLIGRPRHVEVQIVGDTHGQVLHLLERECSIQRRHQKVVEECPSPGIDDEVRDVLTRAAVDAAAALGYVSAGTVEFVVDDAALARRRAGHEMDPAACVAFLEVNTRLQVEHPVTEEVVRVRDARTGVLEPIDLVRWQLLIAGGWRLPATQADVVGIGHAIEVRLYAEDVPAGYLPATGTLSAFDVPALPGIRRELGVRAGDVVSPHYDPMLAKVIATAATRAEAAARLATALEASPVVGVTTNRDLLVAVLRDEGFLAGATTTAYLDDHLDDLLAAVRPDEQTLELASLFAAVHATAAARPAGAVLPGLPAAFVPSGVLWDQHTFAAGDDQPARTVRLRGRRDGRLAVEVLHEVPAGLLDADGERRLSAEVTIHHLDAHDLDVEVDGHRRRVQVHAGADGRVQVVLPGRAPVTLQAVPRFPARGQEEVAGATRSPMPGVVVAVAASVGDRVTEGQHLVSVEAMKMEHRITAPQAGEVVEVRVAAGQQVDADEVLVVVEPVG
ncbi:MAG: biotin carboxylase N-terminal domain-containing protein [Nitriliruptoraceae bacterium]